jgi:hypothetical protein
MHVRCNQAEYVTLLGNDILALVRTGNSKRHATEGSVIRQEGRQHASGEGLGKLGLEMEGLPVRCMLVDSVYAVAQLLLVH